VPAPFTTAAKEEMLYPFVPWSADECIRAFESQGKKAHQGVAPQKTALHQGITWSNSTSALGLRSLAVENRVRSRCTGKERDSESGLDEFGARYYASPLGRFMTPDWATTPIDVPYADFGNPQSLNLYSYVKNNPTTTRDPDGHCCDGDDILNFLGGVANAYGSDNLLGAGRVEQTTTAGKIGSAVGDFGATVTGGLEVLGGGGEALVTAPAGATGVGIVVPAVGVAVAAHGVTAAGEGFGHLFKSASESGAVDKSTPENQERMSQGKAPLDKDGKPVELHHEGQTQNGPVKEMTQQEHRGGENFAKNHTNTGQQPSQINRSEAAKARRQHWKKQVKDQ
jgi:RHS repeat-associated protein